jgi:RHS repeat-associated protein
MWLRVRGRFHYYPFGLTMAGISSKALNFGGPENKIRFQEQEFAHKEFSDGSGLEMYEFKYRMHDPQIGRFWQIDPLADKYVYNSTYAFSENQVISYRELEGLEKVLAIFYQGGPFGGAKTTTPEKAGGAGVIYNDTKRFAESTGKGFAGTVIAPGAKSDNSVKTANDFIKSNYEEGDMVIIYGYSYGGDAAVELSKSLNDQGKKVDLLVTVDNSDGPGNFTVDTDIPENVNTNLNVYQDKPSGTTRANGEANTADDPNKTNVINRNVSSPGTTHGNIQEKNKTLIENVINFFIQQYNPPKK